MAQFGDLLAELRQDRGLTQSELGKVISVTSGTISNPTMSTASISPIWRS